MNNKKCFTVKPIGSISCEKGIFRIKFEKEYWNALRGIEGFNYVNVLWWADRLDDPRMRSIMTADKPYTKGPDEIGVFATRSPLRPNPVCVSACPVKSVDSARGIVDLYYADTENNTPVIDIKPYQPSADRVKNASTPAWCSHWPQYFEDSETFDWASEFNFLK